MKASPLTLKRLADRKLRRWGLESHLRSGVPMICQQQKIYLNLGGFFTIMNLQSEIKVLRSDEPVSDILKLRIKRGENPYSRYQRHLDGQKKDQDYKSDQMAG